MLGSPGICHLLLWLRCHQPQPRPGTTAAGSCVQRGQTCPAPATGPHESPSAPGTGRQQWEEPAQEPGTSMKEEVPRQRAAGKVQAPLLSLGSGWSRGCPPRMHTSGCCLQSRLFPDTNAWGCAPAKYTCSTTGCRWFHLPAGSCEVLQCRQPHPLHLPWRWCVGPHGPCNALVVLFEAKHPLSHGKSANVAPAKGQTAWMYTPCFMGMNNRRSTHCATKEEQKRICRSPEADETLSQVFFFFLHVTLLKQSLK